MVRLFSFLFLASISIFAQNTPMIATAGYTPPAPLVASPGELVTLFVPVLSDTVKSAVKAPSGALPTSLAGVSATLRQITDRLMPIAVVQPFASCSRPASGTCGSMLAVTVQVPLEAIADPCPGCLVGSVSVPTQIAVTVNGAAGSFVDATILPDHIHFLTQCDVPVQSIPFSGVGHLLGLPCVPVVTHADGKLVSANNPALAGEELVAYATGLGPTNPALVTGRPPDAAAPALAQFILDFDFRPNALPSKPTPLLPDPALSRSAAPVFSGATAGFTGLYQINFVVPPIPSQAGSCSDLSNVPTIAFAIQSNLTVNVGTSYGFDGIGICVFAPIIDPRRETGTSRRDVKL